MQTSKIPQAVENLHSFMMEVEKQLPQPSQNLKDLLNDWREIKEFMDAVFYPVKVITDAQKRNEMELDCEAQEEVDCLLWELKINVQE